MSNSTRAMMMGAAGAAGDATYVDDVFSTFLYPGTGSAQTITNGIDLAGEGGMVWFKVRTTNFYRHQIHDTERGKSKFFWTSESDAELTDNTAGVGITSFNNNGFSLGTPAFHENIINQDMVSWTFRKAPGFFDVVTYTGNGTAGRTVAHNLGSVPGMIMVKCTNTNGTNWLVYHRSLGATKAVILDLANVAVGPSANYWNNTAPTSTHFTLGIINDVNTNGDTYVAYLFAHDDQSFGTGGDESIIKCGGFTGANYTESLGFEPQLLLAKRTDVTGDWFLVDSMRGFYPQGTDSVNLRPNTTNDENTASFHLTSDGFYYSSSTATYIYMAIRRPHKPPTDATEVFSAISATASTGTTRTTGFPVDLQIGNDRTRIALGGSFFSDRLRGVSTTSTAFGAILYSSGNAAEGTTALTLGFDNTGFKDASFYSTYPMAWWNFRRAPGFMDIVAYEGDGTSSRNIQHNLATSAELIICKRMDNTSNWTVWSNNLSAGHILQLNGTDAEISVGSGWINSSTSTTFNIGNDSDVNASSGDYVAYLFATLAGISKVGTYTGTGSDKNVDCGFSAGARFILIRRIDSTGDWYVWDTARGIVSGNDPYLLLNSTAAEVTNTDYIDPLSTGFTVTASAPAALNASGGSYIFLAIA